MHRAQGHGGYYDENSSEGMSGLTYLGDPALDAAVQAAAAAAAPPAATSNPVDPAAPAEDNTLRNAAIGGGALLGLYLLYRQFR